MATQAIFEFGSCAVHTEEYVPDWLTDEIHGCQQSGYIVQILLFVNISIKSANKQM